MANEKTTKMCGWCKHIKEKQIKRTIIRRRRCKDFLEAKAEGIKSGKVIQMTCRDELTGFFYRYDKKSGNLITLGQGWNYGA